MLFVLLGFCGAYVVFSIWFFTKVTKGFFLNPEGNSAGEPLDFLKTIKKMTVDDFIMIVFVNMVISVGLGIGWFGCRFMGFSADDNE